MKKILVIATLILAPLLAPSAHALEIEVQPLSLKAKAEILGIQGSVNGQKAIIFTGNTALSLAKSAGQTIDITRQMLVMTGKEVEDLVEFSLKETAAVGKNTLIVSGQFTREALRIAYRGVYTVIQLAWIPAHTGYTLAKSVTKTAVKLALTPVYLLTDIGLAFGRLLF